MRVTERDRRDGAAGGRAPLVVVVILTWNGLDDLVICLNSFSCVDYPNYRVVVVDNGSEDETVVTVRARYAWATLLVNDENLGYVGGNNVGIAWALEQGCEYVFILNNDTKMTPDVITRLVAVMEVDPDIAVCGSKNLLLEDPSLTWGKYGRLTWGPLLVHVVGRLAPDVAESSPKDVDWVIGNGCLMRRAALEMAGVFDEELFQVNEDVDWSLRARRLGYRVVYLDSAAILHRGGGSADDTRTVFFSYHYFLGRNAILLGRRWASWQQWTKLLALMSLGFLVRCVVPAAYYAFSAARDQLAYLRGAFDGLAKRPAASAGGLGSAARAPRDTTFDRCVRWFGA